MSSRVEKLLDFMKKEMGGERKIVKSIPMRPEWLKAWNKLEQATEEQDQAEAKRQALKDQFWSTVQLDTGIFDDMHVNSETNEVEVYEDRD